jgi:hypothetical protein
VKAEEEGALASVPTRSNLKPGHRVSVCVSQGSEIIFPRSCPCCGGMPDTTLVVKGLYSVLLSTFARGVEVPYCTACKNHASGEMVSWVASLVNQRNSKLGSCTSDGPAVSLEVNEGPYVTFSFTRGAYGAMFREANGASADQADWHWEQQRKANEARQKS